MAGTEPGSGAGRIFCEGDAMVDVVAMLPGPLAVGSDTPAAVSFSHGGSAANTAAWLAELGAPACFVARVGEDAFGHDLVGRLAAAGVLTRVRHDPNAATGTCLVLVAPDGQRTMIPSAGANALLCVADLPDDLTRADRVHLSAYPLLRESSRDAVRTLLEAARVAGVPVSVDAASADPIRAVGPQEFLAWLPAAITLLANADEAEVLTGSADPTEAAATLSRRFVAAVVKCAASGAVAAQCGRAVLVPAVPTAMVDSTGAGDAFAAGWLAARHGGADLIAATAAGNLVGARAVTQPGARPPRE